METLLLLKFVISCAISENVFLQFKNIYDLFYYIILHAKVSDKNISSVEVRVLCQGG